MNLSLKTLIVVQISKNPVQYSSTNIKELVEDKIVSLGYVEIENQLADIFTKSLDAKRFEHLRSSIGMCELSYNLH